LLRYPERHTSLWDEPVLVSASLLLILAACVLLMYLKRLSAMLALPLMALLFALAAGVSKEYLLEDILQKGPLSVSTALLATIFGGIIAMFIKNRGVVELMIRYTAELVGDRPLVLALSLMFITAAIFIALGELGTVILVGSIILPIMLNAGIPPVTASAVMIIGLSMGGTLNLRNWQLYVNVLGVTPAQVRDFALVMVALFAAFGLAFCLWHLRPSQLHRFTAPAAAPVKPPLHRLALLTPIVPLLLVLVLDWPIVPAFIAGLLFAILASSFEGELALASLLVLLTNLLIVPGLLPQPGRTLPGISTATVALLPFMAWTIYRLVRSVRRRASRRNYLAILSPLLPLYLILAAQIEVTLALLAGTLLAMLLTIRREAVQILTKSIIESFESTGPALFLIIGIGMLLATVKHPNITTALADLLTPLLPAHGLSRLGFVVMFSVLAPLALYRGPLNLWGLGSGFAAILLAAHALSAEQIMAMLLSVGAVQAVCDPTNSHNFWIASFTRVDALEITKRTLPFIWLLALTALVIAGFLYFD